MATKASQRVQRYVNANGPTIGTVERRVIEQDGLYFKDRRHRHRQRSQRLAPCP